MTTYCDIEVGRASRPCTLAADARQRTTATTLEVFIDIWQEEIGDNARQSEHRRCKATAWSLGQESRPRSLANARHSASWSGNARQLVERFLFRLLENRKLLLLEHFEIVHCSKQSIPIFLSGGLLTISAATSYNCCSFERYIRSLLRCAEGRRSAFPPEF